MDELCRDATQDATGAIGACCGFKLAFPVSDEYETPNYKTVVIHVAHDSWHSFPQLRTRFTRSGQP